MNADLIIIAASVLTIVVCLTIQARRDRIERCRPVTVADIPAPEHDDWMDVADAAGVTLLPRLDDWSPVAEAEAICRQAVES